MLGEVCKAVRGGAAEGRFANLLGQLGKVTGLGRDGMESHCASDVYCMVQHGF